MAEVIEHSVRRLAGGHFEYCKVPEGLTRMQHVLDHIIARQHGGGTVMTNLALCCRQCNLFKGRTSRVSISILAISHAFFTRAAITGIRTSNIESWF
jgi:hypothetical protein